MKTQFQTRNPEARIRQKPMNFEDLLTTLQKQSEAGQTVSGCYLLHFSQPFYGNKQSPVQHYLGRSGDILKRLEAHRAGNGAKLIACMRKLSPNTEVALVRVWADTEAETFNTQEAERRLKSNRHYKRYCPLCKNRVITIKPSRR